MPMPRTAVFRAPLDISDILMILVMPIFDAAARYDFDSLHSALYAEKVTLYL